MTAGIWNTIIDQGSLWTLQIEYQDPNGTPIDLTNTTAEMQLRSLPSDPNVALTLSSANGDIVITALTGIIDITATSQQTGAVDEGTYYYDLEITDTVTNQVTRIIQGQIVVSAEVTR